MGVIVLADWNESVVNKNSWYRRYSESLLLHKWSELTLNNESWFVKIIAGCRVWESWHAIKKLFNLATISDSQGQASSTIIGWLIIEGGYSNKFKWNQTFSYDGKYQFP